MAYTHCAQQRRVSLNGLRGRGMRTLPRMRPPSAGSDGNLNLSTEFARYLNTQQRHYNDFVINPSRPSHLMSPTTIVSTVLGALQRCNWPEPGAGVDTAFEFTMPLMITEDSTLCSVVLPRKVRSWTAKEEWLDKNQFHNQIIKDAPYSCLMECDEWEFKGNIQFPCQQTDSRAIVPVHITTASKRSFACTFCLRRVQQGPLKGCWLIVGVRQGDYSL